VSVSITFQGSVGKQIVTLLQTVSSLTGTAPTISVANTTPGRGGLSLAGVISGNAHFFKDGVASVFINRNNTFTGTFVVTQGILNVQGSAALGGSGVGQGTVIGASATLQVQAASALGIAERFFF